MSELRHNLITRQWVIVAENRGSRPQDLVVQQVIQDTAHCPFCEGHEDCTPGEVLALRSSESRPNEPGWRVRVVPNKYPALEEGIASCSPTKSSSAIEEGLGLRLPGNGLHEIVIESPEHLASVTQLDGQHFADVLEVYRRRLSALRNSRRFRAAILFKNGGIAAGATLAHVHTQLLAISISEPVWLDRALEFQRHAESTGNCLLCQTLRSEFDGQVRIVNWDDNFTAFCPFASRFPYETWIVPNMHASHFDQLSSQEVAELADVFRAVLVKLEATVKSSAYNYIIHTAPFDTTSANHYHWHIEILPRRSNLAGFELGTGCFINTVSPEHAAAALRDE
jgi:UDPglucose--hexose-1-phosphate uridylyltransferase